MRRRLSQKIIDERYALARQKVAAGMRPCDACEVVGLKYNTYFNRLKREQKGAA